MTRAAGRAADLLQLALASAVVRPFFSAIGRLSPGVVERATPEPEANAGRSFIETAGPLPKALFVMKMLATHGLGYRRDLDGLEQRLAAPRAEIDVEPGAREVIFLGDLLFHEDLGEGSLSPALRARLAKADRLVINLEGTVGDRGSELYPFLSWKGVAQLAAWNHTQDAARWISRFDEGRLRALCSGLPPIVFSIANNHALDEGHAGLRRTLDAIERLGAVHVGHQREGRAGIVLDVGARIGLVASSFGHNHAPKAGDEPPNLLFESVPYALPLNALRSEVARLRDLGADYLVASLHWGYEHEHLPREDQLRCVEALWELGFAAVIGHHPHIVQPSFGDGRRWVSFSLGDFVAGDRMVLNRFSHAVSLRFPKAPGGAPVASVIPLVQSPYYARHQTCLLHEASRFEQRVWDMVHRPKLRTVLEAP